MPERGGRGRADRDEPGLHVERLPAHIEREYLRLNEVTLYLDSCSEVYRPLAVLLIGAGLRISEALALRVSDVLARDEGGMIVVYRPRKRGETVGSTKSDRFRSVEIGPELSLMLRDHLARRGEISASDQGKSPVFAMPVRKRKREQRRWEADGAGDPMDRASDLHPFKQVRSVGVATAPR